MSNEKLSGFYNDMSNEEYHGDRSHISSSGLKLMLKDGKAFYDKYVAEAEVVEPYNGAFTFGSYVHSLVLEPEKTDDEFAIFNGSRRSGKAFQELKEANVGKEIITAMQADKAKQMRDSLLENKDAVELLTDGIAEQSLFLQLEGINVKVRADYLWSNSLGGYIADVKTTSENLDMTSLMRVANRYDYDLSAALYVDAYTEQTGLPYNFYFVFMGKDPIETAVFKASEQMLANGRRKYKAAIRKLLKARETGEYFKTGIQELFMFKSDLFYDSEEESK